MSEDIAGVSRKALKSIAVQSLTDLRLSVRKTEGEDLRFPHARRGGRAGVSFSTAFHWTVPQPLRKSSELLLQHLDRAPELLIVVEQLVDLFDRVHHRRVMLVVEELSDLGIREIR